MIHSAGRRRAGLTCSIVWSVLSITCGRYIAAQEPEAMQTVEGSSGFVRLTLPRSWKLKPLEEVGIHTDKPGAYTTVINKEATIPGRKYTCGIQVEVVNGALANPLCQAWRDGVGWQGTTSMQVHAVPVPHVVARFENGNQAVRTFRYVNGRSYRLVTTCSPAEWPKLREDFLAAAARLEVLKPAPWPDLALKGRDNVIQGGVRFSFARGVSKAERAEIMACVAAMQATYTKQHTPLPWSEKDPFLLAVNLTAEDHAEFLDGSSGGEVITLTPRRGLLSTPIGPRGTTHREFFVGSLLLSMLDEHYPGFPRPAHEWLVRGEVSEARMRDTTKKPLPYVTRKFLDSNPTSNRFEEVLPQFAEPGFWGESHAYIALFRAGPEKYQQAYRAFLTEVRRTGDLAKAKQTHLLSLDQEELRSALEKFVKSTLRRAPAVRKKRSGRRR